MLLSYMVLELVPGEVVVCVRCLQPWKVEDKMSADAMDILE